MKKPQKELFWQKERGLRWTVCRSRGVVNKGCIGFPSPLEQSTTDDKHSFSYSLEVGSPELVFGGQSQGVGSFWRLGGENLFSRLVLHPAATTLVGSRPFLPFRVCRAPVSAFIITFSNFPLCY